MIDLRSFVSPRIQMLPRLLLVSVGTTLVVLTAGCSSPAPTRGDLPSGSVASVDAQSAAGGNANSLLQQTGVVQVTGNPRPTIPVILPPKVITFWVYSRKSLDGFSWRDGVFIHAVVEPFRWGADMAMQEERVPLGAMLNMRVDAHGKIVTDQAARSVTASPMDFDAMRSTAKQLPWRDGNQTEAKTRTTIVYDNGTAVALPPPQSAAKGNNFVGPNNTVNVDEVERAMKEADARIREYKSQSQTPTQQAASQNGGSTPLSK